MASSADKPNQATAPAPRDVIALLEQGRAQFLSLVQHIRPELHRYCTRMTGSVADGEDIVQDALARACYELSQLRELPPLRPWLFRIAHNRAIDHWRHETYRASEPLDEAMSLADEALLEPDNVLARSQAVRAAISSFLELAPAQRGCVILKDVLDHSIEEIAVELSLSPQAVKAALHRGRALLQQRAGKVAAAPVRKEVTPALGRYASLFNAHDWDGVRSMLAEDVRLDLVSRRKAAGRRDVGSYFSNYDKTPGWQLAPAWLQDTEVLAVLGDEPSPAPRYIIELDWRDGLVTRIRDFRYVPYIVQDQVLELAGPANRRSPT